MRICFFCKIKDRKLLDTIEFYKTDIDCLKEIDDKMVIATKYSEIDWKADILFVWWWTYAFLPVFIFRLLRKKVFITGTFYYYVPKGEIDYFRRPWWQRCLIKGAFKLATNNILVSKKEYDMIRRDWGCENMSYSPHGIDTEKYKLKQGERGDFFLVVGLIGGHSIVRKSFIEIVDAVSLLISQGYVVKLKIAGHKGDAFDFFSNYIKKLKLENYISFLGSVSVDEKICLMQNCYCYIQPSKYEGFGLAVAEAMACGAPVIVSQEGELPTLVGNSGFILNDITPLSIAKVIKTVSELSNIEEYSKLSRQQIVDNYDVKRRFRELKNIILKG